MDHLYFDEAVEAIHIFDTAFKLASYRMESADPDWTMLNKAGTRFLADWLLQTIIDVYSGVTNHLDVDALHEACNAWGNDIVLNLNRDARLILGRRENRSIIIVMEDPGANRDLSPSINQVFRLMCLHTGRLKPETPPGQLFARDPKDVRKNLLALLE